MMALLPFHVTAGLLSIAAGLVALTVLKGGTLHRQSGLVFVYAMLVMGSTGFLMAAIKPDLGTALGGALSAYLVITGLLATRARGPHARRIDTIILLVALGLTLTYATFGISARSSPTNRYDGYPSQLYFIFGSVTLLATIGDARLLIAGGIQGARRLTRHVWRMGLATFIATASFFLGQMKVIPKPLRIVPLLMLPVLYVMALGLYWVIRVRFGKGYVRRFRSVAELGRPQPSSTLRNEGRARAQQHGTA